ncbi:MAG: glycosyltransferase family 39 protein, partial [Acidobacteriota bacterium]|nr:glycosyltransferase family 39 protein [Acidobacteriota bacterium]MDQ5871485.1 glycosyltransferase family 39 protein [Acidobacteriota bacterium]
MPWEYVLRLGLVVCFALLVQRSARGHAREALSVFWLPLAFGAAVVLLHWIWTGQLDVFPFGFALVFSLSQTTADFSPSAPAVLSHRFAPAAIGILTALTTLAVWGTLDAVPVVHDEAAYLLQSRIFLTGRWTAPGRPVPEFFEQVHVFVTPVLASKYPPGHSIALLPGVALGVPGLMPVVLSGVSGGFLFLLARRFYGGWVALLAWVIWLAAPGPLATRASYLSESTSSALWLFGWWCLIRWRESGEPHKLWLLSLTSGVLCLTRPLTMLAFVIPAGLVVLCDVARRKVWKDFAIAIAAGGLVLTVVPLWSMRTLGTWRTTPYQYYSAVYYPYETFGFGLRETPALRPYPSVLEPADRLFRGIHRRHQIRDLPTILGDRLAAIASDIWGPRRHFLVILAVLGALTAGPPMGFALAA